MSKGSRHRSIGPKFRAGWDGIRWGGPPIYNGVISAVSPTGYWGLTLEHIGEGKDGDYDEEDPNDEPRMRMDVAYREDSEMNHIDDSSYCTLIPATLPEARLHELASQMLDALLPTLKKGESIKRLCQNLSWTSAVGLCKICKHPMTEGDSLHQDCGGDCLSCMAEAGDPDCVKHVKELKHEG